MKAEPTDAMRKFGELLELYDLSVEIMRQNLRRRHPGASEERIEELLRRWLAKADEPSTGPWTTMKIGS